MRPPPPARNAVLGAALAVAALVAAASSACGPGRRKGPPAPNVLVLVMDTSRADRFTMHGHPRPTTPRVAELAADGVTFLDAWAASCWTGPSHATLLTGLRPEHHGYTEGIRAYLESATPTLAEMLRGAGWRTAGFSMNGFVGPDTQLDRGFERFDALYADPPAYPMAREAHRRALAWMEERKRADERFFVFVNDMEPHTPYTPPDEVARRFLPADATESEVASGRAFAFPESLAMVLGLAKMAPRRLDVVKALYEAELATLDAEVGNLLDGMRRAGILDETLVVITSDHGEHLGERGLYEHSLSLHRTLLHVPLVMRLPAVFDGGRREPAVVRSEDVVPTILDVCGVAPPPAGLDGESLRSPPRPGRVARALFGPGNRNVPEVRKILPTADTAPFHVVFRSVYDGRHHLIVRSDGKDELYDVPADAEETRNLAGTLPDVERRLRDLLTK